MDIFTCRFVLFLSVYICLSVCLLVVHAWTNKRGHKWGIACASEWIATTGIELSASVKRFRHILTLCMHFLPLAPYNYERFYVLYSGYVFMFLTFFHVFYFKKHVVKCKIWICKNPTKILWAIIFIDFGSLRSPYCKISYLLVDIKIRVTFSNLTIYIWLSVRR